ncbi:4d7390a1-c76e-4a9c-a9d5-1db0ac30adc7 [Sclerotinia trifoliorum]|uniref:4d7390a1-c76e-4a9c-a9d5-1db0ac30adc7 n=1 Tax=Sclerotinia trifoliorum TaxID=28548 RepID=A0A8H2VXR5_9HELO|nr:4d7390a1-c76e-4a9c-a9d5-1db0ac30adc7 [Sclerotinia trifoliorum]
MSSPHHNSVLVIGGCDIAVFDINTQSNRVDGVKYIDGSLTSREHILQTLQETKPRVIIHTASPKLMIQANTRQLFTDVNINGTAILLSCIKEVGATAAIVYTSSSSVIYNNMTNLYYTHTKAVAEQLILSANKKGELYTAVTRAALLFGEGDTTSTPKMVENARAGRAKFQVGDGTNLYDFTYIGNTAYAHLLAAKALIPEFNATEPVPNDKKINGEAFVTTNDDSWPFWEFTRAVSAAAGHPVNKEKLWVVPASVYYAFAVIVEWTIWLFSFGRKEPMINRRMVKYLTLTRTFDISKAKQRLGYRPLVSMQEGIQRAVDYYVAHHPEEKKKV